MDCKVEEVDLSLIVAMATPTRIIGRDGKLPWRLPSDLKRFRKITMQAGIVVMGYNTYDSILARNNEPLMGRKHIVLTKRHLPSVSTQSLQDSGIRFVGSLEDALEKIAANGGRACVVGGEEIFKLFIELPQVKTVYITTVHAPSEMQGDVYFPEMNPDEEKPAWRCIGCSSTRKWDPRDDYETSYELYERSQAMVRHA